MRLAVLGLIFLGIVAASSAALLMATWRTGGSSGADVPDQQVDILVASKALAANTYMTSDAITKQTVRKNQAPRGSFTEPVAVVGKLLSVPIEEGRALTPDLFNDKDVGPKRAAHIRSGMRDVTISVADSSSITLLTPGSLVDVIATVAINNERFTHTILQRVDVVGVDQNTLESKSAESNRASGPRSVTLELTPEQASKILAIKGGDFSLTILNPNEKTVATTPAPLTLSEIMGLSPEKKPVDGAPAPPAKPEWSMEIFRGSTDKISKETVNFSLPKEKPEDK